MLRKYTWRTGILEAVLILTAALFMVPIIGMLNVAFKPANSQTSALGIDWPPTFDNFVQAWNEGGLGPALLRSMVITVTSVILVVVIASAASYALSRSVRRWSKLGYAAFLVGLMIPSQLALLPLYMTMRDIGLLGSIWALVLLNVGGQMPFAIFLFTGFMRSMPIEFEEAALLDGCGPIGTFIRVVIPLAKPIIGTIVVLTAVGVWNDFFNPLLYLSGTGHETVTVAIYSFVGQYVSQWPLVFAGLVISVLPVLIAYLVLQRYIINGFAGGLKG